MNPASDHPSGVIRPRSNTSFSLSHNKKNIRNRLITKARKIKCYKGRIHKQLPKICVVNYLLLLTPASIPDQPACQSPVKHDSDKINRLLYRVIYLEYLPVIFNFAVRLINRPSSFNTLTGMVMRPCYESSFHLNVNSSHAIALGPNRTRGQFWICSGQI